MNYHFSRLLLSLALFSVSTPLWSQWREILHQTFAVDTIFEVQLDVFGDYELEMWAGNTIMTETNVELDCGSKGILKFLIEQGRYELEGTGEGKNLLIVSKDKVRNPLRNNDKDCSESVSLRIFIPEKFQKTGEHQWRNPEAIDPEEKTMIKEIELSVLPQDVENEALILQRAVKKGRIKPEQVKSFRILRRSIDARGRQAFFRFRVALYLGEVYVPEPAILDRFRKTDGKKKAIIVGAGPAGYFAALELLELGIKPIVFDQGKDVQTRRRDLRAIQQYGQVNPHSNYCFGEGGAGTYSDGKLYTRSHKRGNIEKAMRLFVEHGAESDILIDAHPHIGSNKLPKIVANIRETILHHGGEVHFDSQVTDLVIQDGQMKGVIVNDAEEHLAPAVILATGHSARDIYSLLDQRGITIQRKPFALGVRIEHPQRLIDQIQYKQSPREENLPASSYRLACQVDGRGVFSFCMCPGGLVVPASTAPGEIVVNGMSMSRRDSKYANSGTVVSVELEDLIPFEKSGVFAGLEFQRSVEQAMFNFGDGSQKAPAQRMTDFVQGKLSADLPESSYIPGLIPGPLHELLPTSIYQRLCRGVQEFGRKMKGYFTEEANVIGTESRTSSPVRIPRAPKTMMHEDADGLFPSGEGAGYAGGIISAAMDGQNVARAVARFLE